MRSTGEELSVVHDSSLSVNYIEIKNVMWIRCGLVGNTCVEGKEVKCFNAIAGGEGPRLYVL
jgi:hypothetical protein